MRRVTPRLLEAPGLRAVTLGARSELRLLLLGDSAAAGVSAPSQDEALAVSPDGRSILYVQQDHRNSDIVLVENFR